MLLNNVNVEQNAAHLVTWRCSRHTNFPVLPKTASHHRSCRR